MLVLLAKRARACRLPVRRKTGWKRQPRWSASTALPAGTAAAGGAFSAKPVRRRARQLQRRLRKAARQLSETGQAVVRGVLGGLLAQIGQAASL